jgi:uncharacterized membrane protein
MAIAVIPQVTANLTLSSPNMTNAPLSLNVSSKLTKASTADPIDQFTGVSRKTYATAQASSLLIAAADYDNDGAHKIYIKNTSEKVTDSVEIEFAGSPNINMGKLFGGDWAFFPWDGATDIDITTNQPLTVEYAVFYQTV